MYIDHPNLRPADDPTPDPPDHLGAAVLNGLARPMYARLAWSLPRTLALGILSFGIAPILIWTKRIRQYITLEQQQLWHLSEWLRLNSTHPQSPKLREEAESLRPNFDLRLLVFLSVALLAILFYTQLHDYRRHWLDAVLNCTYLYPAHRFYRLSYYPHPIGASVTFKLFNTWTLTLATAYVCHWLQVQTHAGAVKRFVARFDEIAAADGLAPLPVTMPGAGLLPAWMIAAAIMAGFGIFWAMPMMFAGAAHRQLMRSSTINRAGLALRLQAMMLIRNPEAPVKTPVYLMTHRV